MAETTQDKVKSILQICRSSFVYVGIFSFLVNLLMLTVPLYMLQLFDRVFASRSFDTLIYLSIIALGALIVLGLLDIARSRVLVRVSRWLDNRLSPLALSQGADDVLAGGEYASQSLRDISSIRTFLSGPSVFALFDVPWVPLYLLVVFLLQPTLGLIATLGAIILFIFAVLNEVLTRSQLAAANKEHMQNQQYVDKALQNAEAIQAMGMLPPVISRWFSNNESVLNWQTNASDRAGLILSVSKFFRMTLQLMILGVGAYLVIQNQITPGVMIACSIIASRALAPIEQTISVWKAWKSTRRAYDRLTLYVNRPSARGTGMELPKASGQVSAENITYMPPGSRKPILQNINFSVEPGQIVAIIGPSGAGKSTLARILLGIWKPFAGVARLDGANVYEWERTQFGEQVGYLPQDVDLFHGSIKQNIARMNEQIDDAKVIAAAKQVGAHDLILHMPGGYDFNIGNFNVSGGQRQRFALARAFYGDPCFVVLDEPNSSLDRDGDIALSQAITNAREKGTTLFMISHRPNIVSHADRIIVLNQGRVQMDGPRDDILKQLQEQAQQVQQSERSDE